MKKLALALGLVIGLSTFLYGAVEPTQDVAAEVHASLETRMTIDE